MNSDLSLQPSITLGIEAKSIDHESGLAEAAGGMGGPELEHRRRYRLLSGAARILRDPGATWKEQHRTVGCHRHIGDGAFGVEIRRRQDGKGARFVGVHTCGSVWACPVCAGKIAHQRRDELRLAHAAHARQGGAAYLVTLTFPHEKFDIELQAMVEAMLKACTAWGNSKSYRKFLGTAKAPGKYERLGQVKAIEVTWGEHGWHPHIHLVLFAEPGLQDDLEAVGALKDEWIGQVMKKGLAGRDKLNAMLLHSFDLKCGEFVVDYIAKFGREPAPRSREIDAIKKGWGIHSEATRWMDKTGASKHGDYIGLTPFGLLADAVENNDPESAALYRHYTEAFEGKRQLVWSPGLKKALRIAEIEDEEIAKGERERPKEEHACRIDADDWKLVLQHDARDARFLLLHVAAKYGGEGVEAFLKILRRAPPTNSGKFREFFRTRPR